ncbi:hypothetical protein HanIR_Chr04g0169371 [Helianthus annuus]|nr:hypothetical protein HanIR_Chr04g0169371 [Helianthus annuus]
MRRRRSLQGVCFLEDKSFKKLCLTTFWCRHGLPSSNLFTKHRTLTPPPQPFFFPATATTSPPTSPPPPPLLPHHRRRLAPVSPSSTSPVHLPQLANPFNKFLIAGKVNVVWLELGLDN